MVSPLDEAKARGEAKRREQEAAEKARRAEIQQQRSSNAKLRERADLEKAHMHPCLQTGLIYY